MFKAELEQVGIKIKKVCKKGLLDDKQIYLFGANENSRQISAILKDNGYNPTGIIDNDQNKIGSYCCNIRVTPVVEIPISQKTLVIIFSYYEQEMINQLIHIGLSMDNILNITIPEPGLYRVITETYKGKKVYDGLINKYGDLPIFLCPYTGTGDVYLIGTFWKEYVERNNITDYIFVVISSACKKVAGLFDIKNIVCLPIQKQGEYLLRYYVLCPDKVKLKVLNDGWFQIRDNRSEWFRGYKGLHFTKLFKKFVFDLPDEVKPTHPDFKDEEVRLVDLFKNNGLIKGKTIVLSPYSNTLSDLPMSFWESLSDNFTAKGYKVCTNSSGPNEPAIKGTVPVFFPLDLAPQFISYAGAFVGTRSGFCDVISGANAKKVILYDKTNRFYSASAFEYFNLKDMELCEDALEIEYDHQNMGIISEEIGKYLGGM